MYERLPEGLALIGQHVWEGKLAVVFYVACRVPYEWRDDSDLKRCYSVAESTLVWVNVLSKWSTKNMLRAKCWERYLWIICSIIWSSFTSSEKYPVYSFIFTWCILMNVLSCIAANLQFSPYARHFFWVKVA